MEKTKAKRMPTPKQRLAAKAVIENLSGNNPLPTGQVLENVGYGSIVQDPKRILESIGFKQALYDLGLTEELITTSLVEDIKEKPKARLGELKLGAEILGMVKREDETPKSQNNNTYNFIFSKEVQTEVKQIEDKIKSMLIKPHVQET